MKKIIVLIFCFVPIFSMLSQVKLVDDKITIVAWTGVAPAETTVKRFQELKDCGFNCNLTYYANRDSLTKAMQIANEVGIKMLILCPELLDASARPKAIAEQFANDPATLGYFLKDEPLTDNFPYLTQLAARIESGDNKHFCYVNLNPIFAPADILGAASYSDYLDQFIAMFKPKLLSFDHYPVIPDGNGKLYLRKNWYQNLEIIAKKAEKAQIPFWGFALATAHAIYPVPTLGQLKVQVFSNLAYGAQGIQYFNYWTQSGRDTNPNTKFRNGPIDDITKKKTNVYYYVKEINEEINSLMKVFYNSKVISVEHMGREIPEGTKKLEVLPKNFKLLDTNDKNVIISQLQNGNNMYLVLVNKDFENKIDVTVQLNSSSLKRILNNGSSVSLRKGRSVVTVDPGDVLIYTWKK